MNSTVAFQIKNDKSDLEVVERAVSDFATANGLTPNMLFAINLVLDEAICNVISHGYSDQGEHAIGVRISLEGSMVVLQIDDDGTPFSVLEAPVPDTLRPVGEREIGGLGCHLIRQFMDEVQYQRVEGRNRLIMRKCIG